LPRHPLNGLDTFDVARDRVDHSQRLAREEPIGRIGLDGNDEGARAAELRAEPLVVLVNRIGFGEPRGDVVVDPRDVRARRLGNRAEHDQD